VVLKAEVVTAVVGSVVAEVVVVLSGSLIYFVEVETIDLSDVSDARMRVEPVETVLLSAKTI